MYASVRNLEHVYYEPDEAIPRMCLRMFSRYLSTPPVSILDVGCGTGRDLDVLSHICPDCWGVDHLSEMIGSAKVQRPHLNLRVGDMRSVRFRRTFDVIMCIGSGLMYARSNEDIAKVLDTFAAHAHNRTLLILDVLNAASFLSEAKSRGKNRTEISSSRFYATTAPIHSFDIRRRLLVRQRTWNIPGQLPVEDSCRYRSFFPDELKRLLAENGFHVVGMFDNMELRDTDLTDLKLYVGAIMS